MANNDNLAQYNPDITPQQRRENASKAGKASVKAKNKRKAFKSVFKELLATCADLDVLTVEEGSKNNKMVEKLAEQLAEQDRDVTYNELIAMAQIAKAINGDNTAFTLIRDTMGERPVDVSETTQTVNVKEIPKITIVRKGRDDG